MSDFGTVITGKGGNLGHGLLLDGVSNDFTIQSPQTDSQPSDALSWVICFNRLNTTPELLTKENNLNLYFLTPEDRLAFTLFDGANEKTVYITDSFDLNKTYSVCFTKPANQTASNFKFYVNSLLRNTLTLINDTVGVLTYVNSNLNTYSGSYSSIFNGYMFYIQMYNKELTQDEVSYIYRMEGGIPSTAKSSLVLHIPFNENKGLTVKDYSTYKTDGVLNNYTGDTASLGSNNHFVDAYTLQPITQ